mgnify:CR=1 FL=1|tara:strand:- start:2277 stop:4358 length:2082 start_codon:yes stop_codon:yes gene_type:complete
MSDFDESILSTDEENLTFSKEQIEYLRDEFERQRRWVNLLSTREKLALEELEQTQKSISYRFGRGVTWLPRTIIKILNPKRKSKIVYFINEDEEEKEEDLFPSSLLITPELLPTSTSVKKIDYLVEEVIIAIKRGNISVNQARDMFSEGSFTLDDEQSLEAAKKIMTHILKVKEYAPSVKNIYVGILRSLAQNNSLSAIIFGEAFQQKINDDRALRALVQAHGKCGNFSKPLQYLKKMPKSSWRTTQEEKFKSAARILDKGLKIKMPKTEKIQPRPNSILYHASQSMPHTSSGYAIRTQGLVSALNSQELNLQIILRYGYPLDRNDFGSKKISNQEKIDNVNYYFSHSEIDRNLINYQDVYNFNSLEKYLRRSVSSISSYSQKMKPEIIHSASNFVVGMAGAKAAKALGIPSIYEIRGFWHLTQSTKRLGYEGSDHYNLTERLEIETAKMSDHVFTITKALRDILIENGISENKITVLPNAVDPSKFNISKKDKRLEKELDFQNKVVIGYIGSFVKYEGLDLLLEACSILKNKLGDCFRILLVGDGDMMKGLRNIARFLQLEDIITFTGRVSHKEVNRYYSLIDIAPLPRKGLRVCELVSPLKPFEAMGAGKVLITSSVAALAEIVDDGKTGFVFEKDNADDLARKLELVILDKDLRKQIGNNANKWVIENHSWDVISKRVVDVYQKLTEEKQ